MPEINKIPEVLYNGNQPYHVHYDNLPLKNILDRIDLVNSQVNINADILRGCSGSVGTLSNRLSVSIEDNGHLKSNEIDYANHNIGAHIDGPYLDSETNQVVEYVRMKQDERDKLNLIDSEATNLRIQIEDSAGVISGISNISNISNISDINYINFEHGMLKLRSSDTIFFDFEAPDIVKAHSVFPTQAAHQNLYGIVPSNYNILYPDYLTFYVGTSFKTDTLRVYINGFKINLGSNKSVNVLKKGYNPALISSWTNYYINTIDSSSGIFILNSPISTSDTIIVDFDISYA